MRSKRNKKKKKCFLQVITCILHYFLSKLHAKCKVKVCMRMCGGDEDGSK